MSEGDDDFALPDHEIYIEADVKVEPLIKTGKNQTTLSGKSIELVQFDKGYRIRINPKKGKESKAYNATFVEYMSKTEIDRGKMTCTVSVPAAKAFGKVAGPPTKYNIFITTTTMRVPDLKRLYEMIEAARQGKDPRKVDSSATTVRAFSKLAITRSQPTTTSAVPVAYPIKQLVHNTSNKRQIRSDTSASNSTTTTTTPNKRGKLTVASSTTSSRVTDLTTIWSDDDASMRQPDEDFIWRQPKELAAINKGKNTASTGSSSKAVIGLDSANDDDILEVDLTKPRTSMPSASTTKPRTTRNSISSAYTSDFNIISSTSQLKGFRNNGNTCYINAVLYALTNLRPFIDDLLNERLQEQFHIWLSLQSSSSTTNPSPDNNSKSNATIVSTITTATPAAVTEPEPSKQEAEKVSEEAAKPASEASTAAATSIQDLTKPDSEKSGTSAKTKNIDTGQADTNKTEERSRLFAEFVALAYQCKEKKRGVINPISIQNCVSQYVPYFASDRQQDAHEFLITCLDRIYEDLKPALSAAPPEQENQNNGTVTAKQAATTTTTTKSSVENGHKPPPPLLCPITNNFMGELTSTFVCKSCKRRTEKIESINNLSLDMNIDDDDEDVEEEDVLVQEQPKQNELSVTNGDDNGKGNPIQVDLSLDDVTMLDGNSSGGEAAVAPAPATVTTTTTTTTAIATTTTTNSNPKPKRAPKEKKNSNHSIQELFEAYFRETEVDLKCSQCKHAKATVTRRLSKLPRILILHLKRFRAVQVEGSSIVRYKKKEDLVRITIELQVGDYYIEKGSNNNNNNNASKTTSASSITTNNGSGTAATTTTNGKADDTPSTTTATATAAASKDRGSTADTPISLTSTASQSAMTQDDELLLSLLEEDLNGTNAKTISTTSKTNIVEGILDDDDEEAQLQKAILLSTSATELQYEQDLERAIQESMKTEQGAQAKKRLQEERLKREAAEAEEEQRRKRNVYVLKCIVNHHGSSPEFGHYTCDARIDSPTASTSSSRTRKNNNEVWRSCDDSWVNEICMEEAIGSKRQESGYIFFYERYCDSHS